MYRSPNIVRVIKSKRLRCAGHVATMQEVRSAFKKLAGKPTRKTTFCIYECMYEYQEVG